MTKRQLKLIGQLVAAILLWPIVLPGAGIYYINKSKHMSLSKNSPLVFCLLVLAVVGSSWWFPILFNQTATNNPPVLDGINPDVLGDQPPNLSQLAKVVRVVDGDTIIVESEGTQIRVRLIGIDAPEVGESEQCYGKESSARLTQLLIKGTEVQLVRDETQDEFDAHGRLLAYVIQAEGQNINLQLIQEGVAKEYTYEDPYKFQSQFLSAQTHARAAKLGMWGSACKCDRRELSRECSGCSKQRVTYQDWSCERYSRVEDSLAGQCNCGEV